MITIIAINNNNSLQKRNYNNNNFQQQQQQQQQQQRSYYSVITICTVGYGDFTPKSTLGRIAAMVVFVVVVDFCCS